MNDIPLAPGRWLPNARLRVMNSANPVWHASPGKLALVSGDRVLASVRSNGQDGAKLRWILQVPGWEWAAADRPNAFHVGKTFMTRTGAQIEADDIIASAKEWEG